jgi:hypothetical protein
MLVVFASFIKQQLLMLDQRLAKEQLFTRMGSETLLTFATEPNKTNKLRSKRVGE